MMPAALGTPLTYWKPQEAATYKTAFEQKIVPRILALSDEHVRCEPRAGLSLEEVGQTKLFQNGGTFESEDLITGNTNGVAFRCSGVHAKTSAPAERGSASRRKTLFRGLLFVANYPKPFTGQTYVLPDSFGARPGDAGQHLQRLRGHFSGRGALVQLEDPEFERFYAVYSDDQITARRLLTPRMTERLSEFRKKHGENVYISFVNGNINVAIETRKDLFEPPLRKTLLDLNLYLEYFRDGHLLTGIVHDLGLTDELWQPFTLNSKPVADQAICSETY